MSKQYGLRRRLKRLARLDGIPMGRSSDLTPDQMADIIAEAWNKEFRELCPEMHEDFRREVDDLRLADGPVVEVDDDDIPF